MNFNVNVKFSAFYCQMERNKSTIEQYRYDIVRSTSATGNRTIMTFSRVTFYN